MGKLNFYLFGSYKLTDINSISYADSISVIDDAFLYSYINNSDFTHKFEIEKQKVSQFGNVLGLYYLWEKVNSDYIGFSLDGRIPQIETNNLERLIESGSQIIIVKKQLLECSLRDDYKEKYYDYDFNVLRSYLNLREKVAFNISEELMRQKEYLIPTLIMRKDTFRRFCVWLFKILAGCARDTAIKKSVMQNKTLEHLAYYLITLYLECNKQLKKEIVEEYTELTYDDNEEVIENKPQDIKKYIQNLIHKGYIEEAEERLEKYCLDDSYQQLRRVFNEYARQRRHYKQTDLDIESDIDFLIEKSKKKIPVINGRPKMLILSWNSVNNTDYLEAFHNIGFEIETIQTNIYSDVKADNVDRFNRFLDEHDYDVVFSINFFDYVSEACYTHGIPYLSWAYDSPIAINASEESKYETSFIFLMDTDEVAYYVEKGYKNVFYLPLAVNIEKYDSIICSNDDKERFDARVSFVGNLYKTKLNEYLNYLTDYKKGFFNAILDYNTGRYNSYASEEIFRRDLSEWLDEKTFRNAVFKGESKDKKMPLENNDMMKSIVPRVGLLTNKTITNRERLIIISMLSNHWKFNLYSTDKNELFKNVNECGPVDYYSEMPKVFKCSDINLNITFKSIKCGIPLRCLDIMGCGGFLLTNYQRDFDEHFRDGENLAIFNSIGEAYEKCAYYLSHDEIRQKVANRGHETINKYYTYDYQIRRMMKMANLEYLLV